LFFLLFQNSRLVFVAFVFAFFKKWFAFFGIGFRLKKKNYSLEVGLRMLEAFHNLYGSGSTLLNRT